MGRLGGRRAPLRVQTYNVSARSNASLVAV
jgi:hypothetical protein